MGGGQPYLELFVAETSFYNRIVLGTIFPAFTLDPFPHIVQTWLRNCIGGLLIYFFSGFLWCFYIYYWKRNVYVPKGLCLFLFAPFCVVFNPFCVYFSTAPSTSSNSAHLGSINSLTSLFTPFYNLDLCFFLLISLTTSRFLEL